MIRKTRKFYSNSSPKEAAKDVNFMIDGEIGSKDYQATVYDVEFKPFKLKRK